VLKKLFLTKCDFMRIDDDKESTKYSYICDICGKGYSNNRTCSICNADICHGCTRLDPRSIGDYPEKFCIDCFNVGKKYLDLICIEQEKFDVLVENLEQEWRGEAIKMSKARQKKN